MMRNLFLVSIYFIVNSIFIFGQENDDLRPRIGFVPYGFLNIHTAHFSALPDIPNCCPQFRDGSGFGPGIGLLFEASLNKSWWLGSRLTYGELGASLLADESVDVLVNGVLQRGIFQHFIDSRISAIAVEQSLILKPTAHLLLSTGLSAEMLISDEFRQKETILAPNNGVFTDTRSRSRNEYSGEIPAINRLQAAAILGLSYELPINSSHSTFISPEVMLKIALTDISSGVASWKSNALRFGLSLKFALKQPVSSNEILPEKVLEKTPALVDLKNIDSTKIIPKIVPSNTNTTEFKKDLLIPNKNKEIQPAIHIEKVVSNQTSPILNYIFFNENSAEIPTRYHKITPDSARLFDFRHLRGKDLLLIYYEILNIVGSRMQEETSSVLTITGCNADIDSEKDNLMLSGSRAAAVKQYLMEIWGIDSTRLIVNLLNKPEKPTAGLEEYAAPAAAENRRVELTSNTDLLLAPIILKETAYRSITPIIKIKIEDFSANIDILAHGKILRSFRTNSNITNWNIASESAEVLENIYTCDSLLMRTKNALGEIKEYSIPVEIAKQSENKNTNLRKTDNNSFILFDFNSTELNYANRATVSLIRRNINEDSKVTIRGYADGIGGKNYNKTLSEMRARNVAAEIGVRDADVLGLNGIYLYNNDLPECRFYNRSVHVAVKNL